MRPIENRDLAKIETFIAQLKKNGVRAEPFVVFTSSRRSRPLGSNDSTSYPARPRLPRLPTNPFSKIRPVHSGKLAFLKVNYELFSGIS